MFLNVLSALRTGVGALCLSLLLVSGAYAQKWSKGAPFPDPSEEVYGIAVGGKLYVLGGLGPAWTPKGLVYEYDPAADTWTKMPPMETARHGVAADFIGNKLHVVSGNVQSGGGPAALVETEAHEVLEVQKK